MLINPGILLMLLVAVYQSIMSAIVKAVSGDITTGEQVLAYYLIPLCFFIPLIIRNGFAAYKASNSLFLLWRGVFSAAAVFCFFYASQHIQLGVAAILFNSAPIFIPLLAKLFLKEETSFHVYLGILISLVGVIIVIHPGIDAFFSLVSLVGLASGFLMAISQVMLRHLAKKGESVNKIMFYLYLMSTVTSLLIIILESVTQANFSIFVRVNNNSHLTFALLMLLGLGFLSFIAQRTLTRAFQYMPAAKLVPFLYVSAPISSVIGWIIWDQRFTPLMMIGTLFVIIGVCVITFENRIKSMFNLSSNYSHGVN